MGVSNATVAKDCATFRKQDQRCTAPSVHTMYAQYAVTQMSWSNDVIILMNQEK